MAKVIYFHSDSECADSENFFERKILLKKLRSNPGLDPKKNSALTIEEICFAVILVT